MGLEQETEMTREETDALLGRNETGVLALARDDDPYAIPISYGYDADARRFYMRLVSTPESEKSRFLSGTPDVRLVVYEEDAQTYRSAVVTGTLEPIARDELTPEHVEQYGETKRPLFEIWGQSRKDLDIQLYVLRPTTISGRRTELQPDGDD
ncbi:pyridoxamine 5'-phosphate oxidase family protein [Halosimplex aquaticum]|uniref:Pyridoxamine 5'-phosphate oxidase family protein n=1 Tax=Halosimplex aquaticum TaxID=3026162 RepID=A0ABD5XT50_9EURY|nr:pyridoxamine 5'-phosphate oxidase family protein [Halosimplex aquaticum]